MIGIQEILVGLIFLTAILYLGYKFYRTVVSKGCETSCSCDGVDLGEAKNN